MSDPEGDAYEQREHDEMMRDGLQGRIDALEAKLALWSRYLRNAVSLFRLKTGVDRCPMCNCALWTPYEACGEIHLRHVGHNERCPCSDQNATYKGLPKP